MILRGKEYRKRKVIIMYREGKELDEIMKKTKISEIEIKELIEKYLELTHKIENYKKEMEERHEKQKKEIPPFYIRKSIKDDRLPKKTRYVYTKRLNKIPKSIDDFLDFILKYGNGRYTVLNRDKKTVKHFNVIGIAKFDDPSEVGEEKPPIVENEVFIEIEKLLNKNFVKKEKFLKLKKRVIKLEKNK